MRKVACLLSMVLLCACSSAQSDPRAELEKAYTDFIAAVSARDEQKLKESLPAFRYMEIKNEYLGRKLPFPAAAFDEFKFYPDLKKLTYINTVRLSPEVAYTQHWIKETRDSSDSSAAMDTAVVNFAFVNEAGRWKFAVRGDAKPVPEEEVGSLEQFAAKLKPDFGEELGSGRIPAVPAELIR